MNNNFVLKGNIAYAPQMGKITTMTDGYVVSIDGKCAGAYEALPEQYQDLPVKDYGNAIIIPGLVDLHLHAPQYTFRGLGMDMELLEWLEVNTFPEESKYADLDYAAKAYSYFVEGLVKSATTRACIFGSIHRPATLLLMDMLENSGLGTYVGKVNMDRNCPDSVRESGVEETRLWIEEAQGRNYDRTTPIITPRFVPTCSDPLMAGLEELQKEYSLPVQSHLSENLTEIAWVKELCPWSSGYPDVYDHFGMLKPDKAGSIMAHCVYLSEAEALLLKKRGTFVAHCPASNANVSSGIAPIRSYINLGMNIGLGTDIAGGHCLSVFRAMTDSIQHSKLRWRLVDSTLAPLTVAESFYLATKGGGAFFGKVGSFEEGYTMDAVIINDDHLCGPRAFSLMERIERLIYLNEECVIAAKYVDGKEIQTCEANK